jgi:hypothetical protein
MIRSTTIIGVTALAFLVTWLLCKPLFKTMGPHTWHRAHMALVSMQREAIIYREEHGSLPREDEMNEWLKRLWRDNGHYTTGRNTNVQDAIAEIFDLGHYSRLKRWGDPPVYILSENHPGGGGFYIAGDDGVSSSQGNDPDDINSWDPDSIAFYHRKLWRGREVRDLSISFGVALITFAAFKIRWIA